MTNLDSILKSQSIISLTKVHLVKAMVFPVVMHSCERWAIKKTENCGIDAFELWCWRRLLRALDCKEIQPDNPKGDKLSIQWKDWCQSWSSNTWATWCKELTHGKRPWCWERLRAKREGGDRRWDGWMASLTQWTWVGANSRRLWRPGKLCMLQFTGFQRVRHNWKTEQPQSAPGSCPSLQCLSLNQDKTLLHWPYGDFTLNLTNNCFLPTDRGHLPGSIYLTLPNKEKPCSKALNKGKANTSIFPVISWTSPHPLRRAT